jgi:hypothetical protein
MPIHIRNFTDGEVETAITNVRDGLRKYIEIMDWFPNTNVSEDQAFQTRFKGFYRIRRNDKFCNVYFSLLESYKTDKKSKPTFFYILEELYKIEQPRKNKNGEKKLVNSLEFSFASKLLATLDPYLPVWDKKVLLGCFNTNNPRDWLTKRERIIEADIIYNDLKEWYSHYIKTDNGLKWLNLFDKEYGDSRITDIKKIDLILWSLGN